MPNDDIVLTGYDSAAQARRALSLGGYVPVHPSIGAPPRWKHLITKRELLVARRKGSEEWRLISPEEAGF